MEDVINAAMRGSGTSHLATDEGQRCFTSSRLCFEKQDLGDAIVQSLLNAFRTLEPDWLPRLAAPPIAQASRRTRPSRLALQRQASPAVPSKAVSKMVSTNAWPPPTAFEQDHPWAVIMLGARM